MELGANQWGPKVPHKGGHLLTWKQFKLKQSVTPFFHSKFECKSNGDIHLELGATRLKVGAKGPKTFCRS